MPPLQGVALLHLHYQPMSVDDLLFTSHGKRPPTPGIRSSSWPVTVQGGDAGFVTSIRPSYSLGKFHTG